MNSKPRNRTETSLQVRHLTQRDLAKRWNKSVSAKTFPLRSRELSTSIWSIGIICRLLDGRSFFMRLPAGSVVPRGACASTPVPAHRQSIRPADDAFDYDR